MKKATILMGILLLAVPLLFLGCGEGDDGAPGTSVGTVSGTVTNGANSAGESGVEVTAKAGPVTANTETGTNGTYSLANLPAGTYSVTFSKSNFKDNTATASVLAGQTTTVDTTLNPVAPVVLDIEPTGTPAPGGTISATVKITPVDGSTFENIQWTQSNSVPVVLTGADTETVTIAFPARSVYKDELFHILAEPPITPAQLPPKVQAPASFPEQLQDRFGVQALYPFALEEAGLVTLTVSVTTSSGTYTTSEAIHTELPWKQTPGLRNVPVDVPVLLHGGTREGVQTTWNWSITLQPAGSAASFDNAAAQNPEFTPAVAGRYVVTESESGAELEIFAGNWRGVITGQDGSGLPLAGDCTGCHNGTIAIDKFTPWRASGHAEIFKTNINTSTHYSTSCLPCHSVGYDTDAAAINGGVDDSLGYAAFLGRFTTDGLNFIANANNWTTMLDNATLRTTAQLMNIQCENCHGPQQSLDIENPEVAHAKGSPRINLSSDACGVCHGEPPRHGRFLQWQVSPHSNYELAIDESDSGSCSRCHSANGFIAWQQFGFAVGADVATMPDPSEPGEFIVPWTADEVHPQTCAACHDPHDVGTLSGDGNNAKVRVQNDTPLLEAGYRVLNAGRGAICMVCHNTRRSLRNDEVGAGDVITSGRAPHGGAQADVLMGQNAFFVTVGVRGKHSLIEDTCSNCHMQLTPPPDLLSYNAGGTNHTFLASKDICSECHASITAEEVQTVTLDQISFLRSSLEAKWDNVIETYADNAALTVTLTEMTDPADEDVDLDNVVLTPADVVTVSNFSDSHGRQAIDISVNGGPPGHLQLQSILVNDGATTVNIIRFRGNAEDTGPGETLAKAGWNFLMAVNERSNGIHNPTFSLQILAGAQQAVEGVKVLP